MSAVTGFNTKTAFVLLLEVLTRSSLSCVTSLVNHLAPDTVVLEVTGDFNPPRRSAEALRDLAQGMLPADSNPEDDLASVIEERRLPAAGRGLRFSELPNPLRDFSREVARQLVSTATDIFGLIRWRRAMPGPIEALWSRGIEGIEWLDDTGNWHRLPPDIKFEMDPAYILPRSTPEEITDLEAMAASGIREPLAHSLFREAQRASGQREYASALVMAIAALEIGVKQLIGTLVPGAEWLALHSPSPPLEQILRDYFPTILADESVGGYVASPTAHLMETVRDAVFSRNVTVHRGHGELQPDFIARVLGAVADILWMCDYFTGQKWALPNLSEQTRAALAIPEADGHNAGA
jgi:HEPN domain-containing protein